MNRILRLIYSNKLFTLFILCIQLFIIISYLGLLAEYASIIQIIMYILSAVVIIHEINRSEEATFKITWILLVALLPLLGTFLYIYLHSGFLTKEMAAASNEIKTMSRRYNKQNKAISRELKNIDERIYGLSSYIDNYGGYSTYKNTAVKYFPLGEDMIEEMKKQLMTAEKFIFLEYFIISNGTVWDEILDILKKKVADGVEVRLMYDGMLSVAQFPKDYPEQLKKSGIKCKVFAPVMPLLSTYQNNRDHRKIMVIDGHTAFTGGINLADEYANKKERFGHWKDTGIMLKGDGAKGFCLMFLEMWNMLKGTPRDEYGDYITPCSLVNTDDILPGYVIPFGDSPLDNEPVGEKVYLDILDNAVNYVHIMTPYLVIDSVMTESLKYAAKRGVEVIIILPHIPDKKYAFYLARSYYPELIDAGVQIYEYKPGFVHAKSSVSDDKKAVVGTINHDYRSLYLHYECAAYMYDVPEIQKIEEDFQNTLKSCIHITWEEYKQFKLSTKLAGNAIRLVAPLL